MYQPRSTARATGQRGKISCTIKALQYSTWTNVRTRRNISSWELFQRPLLLWKMFLKMQEDNQDYEPESKGRNANETNTVVDAWEKLRLGDGLATSPRRLLLHEPFSVRPSSRATRRLQVKFFPVCNHYKVLGTANRKTTKSHMQTQRNIRA